MSTETQAADEAAQGAAAPDAGDTTGAAEPTEPTSALEAMEQALAVTDEDPAAGAATGGQEEEAEGKDDGAAAADEQAADEGDAGDDDVEIPDDIVNPKSRERFREMATRIKEFDAQVQDLTTERDTLREDVTGFRQLLVDAKVEPEEFGQMLDYSRLVKTGDFQGALAILDAQREALARAGGLDVAGVDILGDHPDLAKDVESMDLTRERALEIARARNAQKAAQQQHQQRRAPEQRSADPNTELMQQAARAQDEIAALEAQWAKSDVDFAAKQQKLVAKAGQIARTYPPHLWKQAMQDYYDTLADVAEAPKPKEPAPLRPKPASGRIKQPSNSLEAMAQALGMGE